MSEQREITDKLKDKTQRLISLYEHTKSERDNLLQDKQQLESLVNQQRKQIADLENKHKKVQLAEAFRATSEDTKDAKLKVGRIVKEIDKCIALLNK